MSTITRSDESRQELETVVIRFAGDSGDGMQLTGMQFSSTASAFGHDISTLPDYPAEIRAPAGTLAGVSGFQLKFSSRDIHTPGDEPNVLVAMNPAALKVNLNDLEPGGTIIANSDAFSDANLKLAKYEKNPLTDGSLAGYRVIPIAITTQTVAALADHKLSKKEAERCKNLYTLGIVYWLFDKPKETTERWLDEKFGSKPQIRDANIAALHAGYNFAETIELFTRHYKVGKAELKPGIYRQITGNQALAIGCVAAAERAKLPLFYGSYPITPASDILHELSALKHYGVKTFQAEDEIAAVCAAIGAAYAGDIAVTGTSGPGVALKTEAIGLAVMLELPLVIVNVQRGGPSTGLPTKTEQTDLFQAVLGRNGECPVVVLAPSSPADCFDIMFEAVRLATKYMTPVFVLSDGYIANGAEPWRLPEVEEMPDITVNYWTTRENFQPYSRNEALSRPWVIPGQKGFEHRIGGLEKQHLTGAVSYDNDNHHLMVSTRAQKVAGVVADVPPLKVVGPEKADLLILGWGGTGGAILAAGERLREDGLSVATAQLRHLNPFPANLGEVLRSAPKVLVPEINLGQLRFLLRAEYLVEPDGLNLVRGLPFKVRDITNKAREMLNDTSKARKAQ